MTAPFHLEHLGSPETAESVAARAARIPAYSQVLTRSSWGPAQPFHSRPLIDKSSYLLASPYDALLADDIDQAFMLFRSAGSSGRSFYWPQLRPAHALTTERLRAFLEAEFEIHRRRTLAVVGLALGSWIGGDYFSWALKNVAFSAEYPFSVFCPGSRHEEIIDIARAADQFADQILFCLCPSAIGHLHLLANSSDRPLPLEKSRYIVLGEPFPESFRTSLRSQAGTPAGSSFLLSLYGSADTGLLGVESGASAALRQLLTEDSDLAGRLGFAALVPHFFHFAAPDAYLEVVKGELCVTRWQGIPLVRYNLHDAAAFFSWSGLQREIVAARRAQPHHAALAARIAAAPAQPDILAITGRADRGTNLSESMLDDAVHRIATAHGLTGAYRASIAYEADRQFLACELETKDAPMDEPRTDAIYAQLVAALGDVQPEFQDDWQNIYRHWDADPAQRIVRIQLVRWPALSNQSPAQIKRRSIQS